MGQKQSKPRPPPQPTPAPGPVFYKVDNGNWTDSVIKSGGVEGWWDDYEINFAKKRDPAVGCSKEFVSEYKCAVGTNKTKTADASKEAYGKVVVYDCDTEYNIAASNGDLTARDNRLRLTDEMSKIQLSEALRQAKSCMLSNLKKCK